MNQAEFFFQAKTECPEDLRAYVAGAQNVARDLLPAPLYPDDIDRFIQYVRRLVGSLAKREDEKQQPDFKLTPQDVIASNFLARKIRPWVKMVRKELFGSPQPPFSTLEEAEQWIGNEAQKDIERAEAGHGVDIKKLHQASLHLMEAYRGRSPVSFPYHSQFIEYAGADGKLKRVLVREFPAPQDWTAPQMRETKPQRYSLLAWLGNETRAMARATGFNQPSLIQYVLCPDSEPILPRYEMTTHANYQSLPTGEEMRPTSVHLTIRATDLSFEELRQIYHAVRGSRQVKWQKGLTKKHETLDNIVRQKGGPLKGKGSKAFWLSVMNEINEWIGEHPENGDPYTEWRAVKKAYKPVGRLKESLSS